MLSSPKRPRGRVSRTAITKNWGMMSRSDRSVMVRFGARSSDTSQTKWASYMYLRFRREE